MNEFIYQDHTADIQFQAFGKNLEEAFKHAALAVINVIVDPSSVQEQQTKSINVKGKDLKSLLYNFLEELLFVIDAEQFIPKKVSALKINHMNQQYWLTGTMEGEHAKEEHDFKTPVKAITYNDMIIKEDKDKVMIQCVVDI